MKRLICRLKAAAAIAAILMWVHPLFAAPAVNDASTPPPAQSMPHPATQLSSLHPAHKTGPPSAWAPAHADSAASQRDQRLQARRQRIMSAMTAGKQLSARSSSSSESPAAVPGLAINFPGFLQGDVFTMGVSSGDRSSAAVAVSTDVNKDGLADLINVQMDGTLDVLLNPGKGKLSSMQVSSVNKTGTGSHAIQFAQAIDLNGDGYPEIVALDAYTSNVMIFPNHKDGTFGAVILQPINFTSGSVFGTGGGLAFGDFNGDGVIDMAAFLTVYGYSSDNQPQTAFELRVLPGKGDGTFGAALPEQYTLLNSFVTTQPGQIAVADIDKDGNLDIAYLIGGFDEANHPNGELWVGVLLGSGNGKFSNPAPNIPDTGAVAPVDGNGGLVGGIILQDFDGDGNLDVMFTNATDQNLYMALGNGDGTFQSSTKPLSSLGYPNFLAFADVTGDGVMDVISYGDGYTSVYPGMGKGAFGNPVSYVAGLAGLIEPEPADYDGDGKLDIARTDAATDMSSVQLQTAAGILAASPVLNGTGDPDASGLTGESASLTQAVATGDFNGDGVPDVLVLDYSTFWRAMQPGYPYPLIKVGLNDGKGNFTYQTIIDDTTLRNMDAGDVDEGLVYPMVADFNGDNIADFIIVDDSGALWVVLSTGPGKFAAPKQIPLGQPYACHFSRMDIGDVNGDGKKDAVFAYSGDANCSGGSIPSGVMTLLSKGDGTFTPVFVPIGSSAYLPKLIDFDGDGKLDLALSDIKPNQFSYDFFIVPGNGDGTFNISAATQPLAGGTGVTAIIPGDFDGDGKQDLTLGIIMRVDSSGFLPGTTGLETLQGRGDFTFGVPQSYAFGGYPYDGQYADFNGDGRPDLALNVGYMYFLPNPLLGNFGYMVNVGGGAFSAFQPGIAGIFDLGGFFAPGDFNDYGNLFVADFNNDGAPDVLSVLDYDEEEHYSSSLLLNSGAISFSLAASSASVNQDDPVTLTATLKPTVSTQMPSGTVSFYENGALLQTAQVADGTATLMLSSLAVGSNTITAAYSGDTNFNAATANASVSVAVATLPPAFTMSVPTPAALTLTAGQTGTVSLSLTGNATFSGVVTFACSGAPDKSTCTVVPAQVTLAPGQTANAAVVVTTTAATTQTSSALPLFFWSTGAGSMSLAGLALLLWPGRTRRIRSTWMIALLLISGGAATLSLSGCGGGSSKTTATAPTQPAPPVQVPGTPTGTSTITVTAMAGSITQTQTLSLTVQ